MKQKTFLGIFLVVFLVVVGAVFLPVHTALAQDSSAWSGLVQCGKNGDPTTDPAAYPCTPCHEVLVAKTLMDYLTGLMAVGGTFVITLMGGMYVLSGANESWNKTAKEGITRVVLGVVFMLSAWLIVSTVLRVMASDQFVNGGGGFIGLT